MVALQPVKNRDPVVNRSLFPVYAVAALVLGLLSGAGSYANAAMSSEQVRPLPVIAWALVGWSVWLLLVPVVARLARRFPVTRERRASRIALHGAAALGFVLAHEVLYIAIILAGDPQISAEASLIRILLARLSIYGIVGVLVYGAVVATEHVVQSLDDARRREIDASRLEAELADARLQSLAMQLQPHFLFNTLNAATGLLREGRSEAAAGVLVELGELLRDSLDGLEHAVVTLEKERATLERYLAIQAVRFGDRIQTEVEIADGVLTALLPHFLLQPLVENAFKHGVGRTTGPGQVSVRAWRDADALAIEVRDSGPGFVADPAHGTGLRNTRARLRACCGDDFQLSCSNDGGAVVRVALPFRTAGAA